MALTWTKRHILSGVITCVVAFVAGNIYVVKNFSRESRAIIFRAQFVALLETLIFIGARYIWRNVNRALFLEQSEYTIHLEGRRTLFQEAVRTLTFIFLILTQLSYFASAISVYDEPTYYGMIAFIALGIFIQLVTSLFCLNTLLSMYAYFRGSLSGRTGKGRRSRISVSLAVVYAISMGCYGVYFASQPPIIKNVAISIPKFPPSMDNFRVALISDVHLGTTVGRSKLTRIVNMVNSINPDVVVMVGDFVDAPVHKLRDAAKSIQHLRPKQGTYFVTGNHEYFTGDVDGWFEYWRSLGVTVLHNQHVKIHSAGGDQESFFYLAGVDDLQAERLMYDEHGMDLDKALAGCDNSHAVILLAHQPAAAKRALDSKHSIQLVLSGHTHGGQIFPMMIGAYFLNPFFAGLYSYRGSQVYVSQGTVYWGIPMRVGSQHEITAITLTAQP